MKNNKICFQKTYGLVVIGVLVLVVFTFALYQLSGKSTSTNTRASASQIIGSVLQANGCYDYDNSSQCLSSCLGDHSVVYRCSGVSCCPRVDQMVVDINISANQQNNDLIFDRFPKGVYDISFMNNTASYIKAIGGVIKSVEAYCDKADTSKNQLSNMNSLESEVKIVCNYDFNTNQVVNGLYVPTTFSKQFAPYYRVLYVDSKGVDMKKEFTRPIEVDLTPIPQITPTL